MSKNLKKQIEALLFATQGLSTDKISETLKTNKKEVKKSLKELEDDYQSRDSAFIITNTNDFWKLTVGSEHVPVVKDLIPSEFPKSILETLAVIAWKNPVHQSDVIKIRGNKAYNHINQLEEEGFISSTPIGRTYELKVTDKFYEYFNADPSNVQNVLNRNIQKE